MSRDTQRLNDYIAHITEAIERIERYTEALSEIEFLSDERTQDAVIRNIEIIGEASHNIECHYPDFAAKNSQLPFAYAYQMRNAVAHGYFKVDFEIVWRTIQRDLPEYYHAIIWYSPLSRPKNTKIKIEPLHLKMRPFDLAIFASLRFFSMMQKWEEGAAYLLPQYTV